MKLPRLSPAEIVFAVLILWLCTSCSAAEREQLKESSGKGAVIAAGAGGGALLGGPLGAFVGGALAYFGIEEAEAKASLDALQVAWNEREIQHGEELRQAQASGLQQGSDQTQSIVAQLTGNDDAAAFFRDRAAEATQPLRDELESQKEKYEAELLKAAARATAQKWGTILAFVLAFIAYAYKQRVWGKKDDRKFSDLRDEILARVEGEEPESA